MLHHDVRPPLKQPLSRRQEGWLYLMGGLLALSGVGWLVCHYGLRGAGPAPHPWEVWWLRVHGAAMLGFLVVFGTLLPGHVKQGWRNGFNRGSGLPVLVATGLLIITGYGLYYLVSDELRAWASIVHWTLGLAGIVAVGVHAALGRQHARVRRRQFERELATRNVTRRLHPSP
jgi:hypothetical protein